LHSQGFFMIQTACPDCRGEGSTIRDRCADCHGEGTQVASNQLSLNIPAGIDEGQTLRLAGKGEVARGGGTPGHLYVVLRVAEDANFERHGEDVLTEVAISYVTAALGGQVEIPTLEDECTATETLDIAAGTQPGDLKVRSGKGIPRIGARGRGDHVIRIRVDIPTKLPERERELLKQIADERGENVGDGKRSLFGRRKKG
jgi:molecular chaperone DnaJ